MLCFQIRNHMIIQIFQESTSGNHSSCRTIANCRNTIKANLLNNTKDSIINRIIKSQTIHTRPTIFCRISKTTAIINDRCRSIRTKSLRNYIADNFSNRTKEFLIFITRDDICTGFYFIIQSLTNFHNLSSYWVKIICGHY